MRSPQISYFTGPLYHDLPTYTGAAPQKGRVFLVAVQGEQLQTRSRGSFDRVHVMVVDPNQMADFSHPLSVLCALPDIRSGLPEVGGGELLAVKSRPVCGEILRNQQGELYERRGAQLVPLRNLVTGPEGRVIEFLPSQAHGGSRYDNAGVPESVEIEELPEDESKGSEAPQQNGRARSRRDLPVRKLFPDPGQLRLLSYGEFSRALAPQLEHPQRLRETHRLPCYLQVFEVFRPISFQKLAGSMGDDASALHVLNSWLAQKLGLTSLLPALRNTPADARQFLTPGDFVCRLQVVRDPTSELGETWRETSQAGGIGAMPVVPTAENPLSSRGKTIPDCYLKPWEFKFSRDEVLYDMKAGLERRGWLARTIAFFRKRVRRKDMERWSMLLVGKGAEDQLWAVRPPQHSLNHPQMRAWACNVLSSAGYDTQPMLAEWEIYWRRKGVS